MRLEIGKLVIVFVAFLNKQLVNRMQLLTCFSSFSLGGVLAKFDSYWLYYCVIPYLSLYKRNVILTVAFGKSVLDGERIAKTYIGVSLELFYFIYPRIRV